MDELNKVEACEWVHTRLIVGEMPTDELTAAFAILTGRVPEEADRLHGLFRRCFDVVMAMPRSAAPRPVPVRVRHRAS